MVTLEFRNFLVPSHIFFITLNGIFLALILFHEKGARRHIKLGVLYVLTMVLSLSSVATEHLITLYTSYQPTVFNDILFRTKIGVMITIISFIDLFLGIWVLKNPKVGDTPATLLLLVLVPINIFLVSFFNSSRISYQHYSIAWILTFSYLLSIFPLLFNKSQRPLKPLHSYFMFSVVRLSFFALISSSFSRRIVGPYHYAIFYNPFLGMAFLLAKYFHLKRMLKNSEA